MPTLLALLLASCAGFLVARIPLNLPLWIDMVLQAVIGLAVFIPTRKFLRNLRP